MKRPSKDLALWFFGLSALACLSVSLPATAKAMELFHGNYEGIAATLVFEIGAVGAELATLAIPQWRKRLLLLTITLLLLTTGGNYALGVDTFGGAALAGGSTYAEIRAAGAGWLLAIMSSAIFPALLFVFLTAFTARYRMVRGGYDTPMGALAFWLSSYGQALNTRVNTAEQRVNSLEQDVNTREQQALLTHATTEQMRADYEQRLDSEALEHARILTLLEQDVSTAVNTREQIERAYDQQLNTIEQARLEDAHELSTLRRDLAGRDQQVNELLDELSSTRELLSTRPEPMSIEVIRVARGQYTYEQLAQFFDTSVSTVRRRLTQQEVLEG